MTKYRVRATALSHGMLLKTTAPASWVDARDLDRLRGAIEMAKDERVLIDGHQSDRKVFVIDQTGYLLLWQLVGNKRPGVHRAWAAYADDQLRAANTGQGVNIVDLIGSLEDNERTIDL